MTAAAIISAVLPALIAAGGTFLEKKFAKGPSSTQYPTMGEGQQNLQQQIISMLGPLLSGEGGLGGFEDQARKEFHESTVPGLAQRFSNLGLLKSSSFNQALGKAGQDLSGLLSNQRIGLIQSLLPSAFASQFGTGIQGGQPSAIGSFFGGLSPGLGKVSESGFQDLIKIIQDKFNKPPGTETQPGQVA